MNSDGITDNSDDAMHHLVLEVGDVGGSILV
jgi:hypothetical protein